MWIALGNVTAQMRSGEEAERRWLADYLTFDDERARYYRKYTGGDGKVRLFNVMRGTFPSGFYPLVKSAAEKQGMKVEVIDQRVAPCARDASCDLSWLRPSYQLPAVEAAIAKTRGIWWIPTGGGKTHCAVGLAKTLPCKWLLVVHRATLMDQAAARWEQITGEPAGRIGEGTWTTERFTAATFQTLHARLDTLECKTFLDGIQGVLIDEVHTLPAATFFKVANSLRNAYWRIGMSGTPLARGDKRSLLAIAATGPVIYRVRPEVLIAEGVLARPRIRLSPVKQLATGTTWNAVHKECIVQSGARNDRVVQATAKATKPCLVFVKEIAHGKALEQAIRRAGMSVEFVWGTDSVEERKAAVRRLVHRDIDVLVASVVFNEGVDIPELRSVVIGSGGKSVIAALQRIGRGSRVSTDKTTFEVFDIADHGNHWLERHTRSRIKAYASEGFETIVESPTV